MEMSIVTNRPVFMNKSLEKATIQLMKCNQQIKTRQYDIAAILADIDTNKLYQDDGFASTQEYARNTFGMEKTLCYMLIEVGKTYTRPILSDGGKVIGHCSNLLPPVSTEKQDAPLHDFMPGQIGRMISLGRDKIKELIEDGSITPTMTHREIDTVVKAHKPPKAIKGAVEPTEPVEPVEGAVEPTEPVEPVEGAVEPMEPVEPVEGAVEPMEPITVDTVRSSEWDNISTDILIAELRARGFSIYDHNGKEMRYNWN